MSPFHPQEERQLARDFVLHYLKDDGVFVTRLLSVNSSDLVVTEIINQLWIRYKTATRLYSTVNPQRHNHNIPTTPIANNENNMNTSISATNINYQNGNTNHRQRPSRIPPPPPLAAYVNQQKQGENKSSKDTDV